VSEVLKHGKAVVGISSVAIAVLTAVWVEASIQVTTYNSENVVSPDHWYERSGAWQFTAMHLLALAAGGLVLAALWLGSSGRRRAAYSSLALGLVLALLWTAGCLRVVGAL
jgi:hypothetical protein